MKTYYIMISKEFMKTHPRTGNLTFFVEKILEGQKIHTIRGNYELWKKRIDEVNNGIAKLELKYWSGSPYNYKKDGSKQVCFATLLKGECSIQKAEFDGCNDVIIDGHYFEGSVDFVAENDGLSMKDFIDWFRLYPKQPMAIIHFTNFRY